jgi:hypothetical protein
MSRMSENVGASTSRNPKGLHGLYRDNFTFFYFIYIYTFYMLLKWLDWLVYTDLPGEFLFQSISVEYNSNFRIIKM